MPLWGELTSPMFDELRKPNTVAILPCGSLEAHGRHLPLFTDMLLPTEISKRVAEITDALVLPPIPFGDSWHFKDFPGTISISPETLRALYIDVLKEIITNGIKKIIVLNGHGGNASHIRAAAEEVTEGTDAIIVVINWWLDLGKDARAKVLETPEGHAAEDETSEVMAVRPDLVDLNKAVAWRPKFEFSFYSAKLRSEQLKYGMYGDPTRASIDKGRTIIEAVVEELVEFVKNFERGDFPKIQ